MDEKKISNEELLEKLKRIKHPNNPPDKSHISHTSPHPYKNQNISSSSHHPIHHQKHPTKEINPVLWILIILGAIILLAGLIYLITFVINLPKPENKDVGGYGVTYGNPDTGEIPSGFDAGGSSSSSNISPGSSSPSDSGTISGNGAGSAGSSSGGSSEGIPPPPPLPS